MADGETDMDQLRMASVVAGAMAHSNNQLSKLLKESDDFDSVSEREESVSGDSDCAEPQSPLEDGGPGQPRSHACVAPVATEVSGAQTHAQLRPPPAAPRLPRVPPTPPNTGVSLRERGDRVRKIKIGAEVTGRLVDVMEDVSELSAALRRMIYPSRKRHRAEDTRGDYDDPGCGVEIELPPDGIRSLLKTMSDASSALDNVLSASD